MTTRSKRSHTSPFRSLPYTTQQHMKRDNKSSQEGTLDAPSTQETILQAATTENEKPTWAKDESESELSPSYQRQLAQERDSRKDNEEMIEQNTDSTESPSLLHQAQNRIKAMVGTPRTLQFSNNTTTITTQDQAEEETSMKSLTSLQSIGDNTVPPVGQQAETHPHQPKYEDTTVDGWGIIDDYEEDSSQQTVPTINYQDEINTIDSGKTSVFRKKDLKKTVIPKYVRYQLMIPPEDDQGEVTEAGYRDNMARIKEVLTTLVTQLRIVDEKAEIISWRSKKEFSFLPKGEFPSDISTIAKYFKGFQKKMRQDRRVYIKFGVHTKGNFDTLEKDLQEWTNLYSYTMNRCLIQSDDAGFVGVLCYTSQFTDISMWRKEMMSRTTYEWGFKMVPITSSDKHLHWNKRLKAVGAYVPIENVDEAKYELSELLLPEDETMPVPTHDLYIYRFVFVPPEETLGEDPEPLIAYQSFVNRHRSHTENLKAKLCSHIKVHLDHKLRNEIDATLTLRRMILAITVKDKANPLFSTALFHAVDFVPDTNKLWLPPQEKPQEGGPAIVFTFYKPVEKEARQMVSGLGRYIARMYGSETAKQAFTKAHWRATKGWRYRVSTGTFDRPDAKNLLTTMAYDNNLSAVRRLQNMSMAEKTETTAQVPSSQSTRSPSAASQSAIEASDRYVDVADLLTNTSSGQESNTDDSNSTKSFQSITAEVLQQENEMVHRIKQQRQQAQSLLYKDNKVHNIAVPDEEQSQVSELTDESVGSDNSDSSVSISSITSKDTSAPKKQGKKGKAKISFNFNILNQIVSPGMSYHQAKSAAEAYFSHKVNHETLNKDRILHTFLAQRFPEKAELPVSKKSRKIEREKDPPSSKNPDEDDTNSDFSRSVASMESQVCMDQQIAETNNKEPPPPVDQSDNGHVSSQNTDLEE